MSDLSWKLGFGPNDGKFRLYGLHVKHEGLGEVFEAHYVALDEDGQLILPGGDNFDDWHFTDFECHMDVPSPPPAVTKGAGHSTGDEAVTPVQFEWADEQTERAYRKGDIGKIEFLKRMSDLGYGPQYLNYLVDKIDNEKSAPHTAGDRDG